MPDTSDYERGKVDATLGEHAAHLAKINGSIEHFANEVHTMTLAIQRLADAAASDRATVITTATALKDADNARRDKSEAHWTPWQRISVGIAAVAAVIGIIYEVIAHVH